MALHIFDSQIQGIFFVIIIIFAPLCTLAVVLRFIACRMARRKLGLEDWFALLALIIYLASSIVCAIGESHHHPCDYAYLIPCSPTD